ncbi:MAG: hypothetical protein AAGA20_17195 [Planctomycetota bacterium]
MDRLPEIPRTREIAASARVVGGGPDARGGGAAPAAGGSDGRGEA